MTDWQPIETAPKDGTPLLLWDPDAKPCIVVGYWLEFETQDGGWLYDDDVLNDIDPSGPAPSHWMPLPAPPKETQ